MAKTRTFRMDLALDDPDNPVAGDLHFTARTVNRITEARLVDSRVWGNRWAITTERLIDNRDDRDARLERARRTGERHWITTLYQRGERPTDFYDQPWPPEQGS